MNKRGLKIGWAVIYTGMLLLICDALYILNVVWYGRLTDMVVYMSAFFAGLALLNYGEVLIKSASRKQPCAKKSVEYKSNTYAA